MNRVCDYTRFGVWFTGLGYIALWPLTARDGEQPASFVCRSIRALPDFLCGPNAGLHLSPGLHLAGMAASGVVALCLLSRLVRWRVRPRIVEALPETSPIVRLALALKGDPPPPRRYVQPRSHFGLRNAPQ